MRKVIVGLTLLFYCRHCRPHLSQRAKEDVLQKEVKVKILKDSINLLVATTSPPGGGSGQELTTELEVVLANYHKLCDRFKSKCHTLEVMCADVWILCVGEEQHFHLFEIKRLDV